MNVVLLADKKIRKNFESAVRDNANINLLGVEMVIRGNTMTRIAEHHNPHVLIIYRNVPAKDGLKVNDLISFLRITKPNMRIVYVYGTITDNTDFAMTAEFLMQNGINDIVPNYNAEKVLEVVEEPIEKGDVMNFIEELFSEETSETVTEEKDMIAEEQKYDELHIDFPTVTEINQFDIDNVMYITSQQAETELLRIGIAQLQHHNGCTHTSFEIASMLSRKNSTAIIMADDETFENLAVFNRINPIAAKDGLNVHGIDVYPYSKYGDISKEYSIVVCDFSYLREEQKKAFMNCDVKIMLSSSAEWDISTLTRFIKYDSENSARDIHFLFPRVSSTKFVKYNKQLLKSGITAYRLHNSPDWSKPNAENITVYKNIFSKYTVNSKPKKSKRRLLKVK